MATDARREGKRSISFTNRVCPADGNLGELVQGFSVVVARPSRLAVRQTLENDVILTWDVFRDVQIVSKVEPLNDFCGLKIPRGLRLEPGEVAMPRAGGRATIAGVEVTIGASNVWTPENPGQRYAFLATICSGRLMILPLLGFEVFTVFEGGRIAPVRRHVNLEFQQQMEALGTVEVLDRFASLMTARDVQ